jgi:hypothetical protein
MKDPVVSSALIENETNACKNKLLLSYATNDLQNIMNVNGSTDNGHYPQSLKLDLNNDHEKLSRDSGIISRPTSEITVPTLNNNNLAAGGDIFYYSHNLTSTENRVIFIFLYSFNFSSYSVYI